ncbi:MAG: hypothetical protein ACRDX8_09430, partial [Acidimicrobiales bacterium]
ATGSAPGERTIQRYFARIGLTRTSLAGTKGPFGRFEANEANEASQAVATGAQMIAAVAEGKEPVSTCPHRGPRYANDRVMTPTLTGPRTLPEVRGHLLHG